MYLSKLTINPLSPAFRRDVVDVHDMHRTVMSGFPELPPDGRFRQQHRVLWRLDQSAGHIVQYVQSETQPSWDHLTDGHLLTPAQIRPLRPVIEAIAPGRRFSFRLLANPTSCTRDPNNPDKRRRLPIRKEADQIKWLTRQGEKYGFVIPMGTDGRPDLRVTTEAKARGKRREPSGITIQPVRFEGHLVVTDGAAFTEAVVDGVGRAKAYGCGLISLAPSLAAA